VHQLVPTDMTDTGYLEIISMQVPLPNLRKDPDPKQNDDGSVN
jgi:hypothetical protein